MKLIHIRVNDNYRELIAAGLDSIIAKMIAASLRARVILEVAISDLGVHMNVYENGEEKQVIFKFSA